MAKYEWSEVFMSIEGEARWAGHPTVYIRFAKCNFSCRGFNNPEKLDTESEQVLGFDPKKYTSIKDIPLITRGCDSIYSWSDKFSHMWEQGDEKALAAEVLKVLPHNTFQNPVTGKRVILSLTGGEPTIRLKFWIPILEELYVAGMRTILVETNCAAPMRDKDMTALYEWVSAKNTELQTIPFYPPRDYVKVVWSNSPKVRMSGEVWEDAIRPEIAIKQAYFNNGIVDKWSRSNTEQYFKFVCGPNNTDFNEVAQAMQAYYDAGIPKIVDVYIMPVACTEEQQQDIAAKVASMCMDKGYIYCHRIQNSVFGNGVGT